MISSHPSKIMAMLIFLALATFIIGCSKTTDNNTENERKIAVVCRQMQGLSEKTFIAEFVLRPADLRSLHKEKKNETDKQGSAVRAKVKSFEIFKDGVMLKEECKGAVFSGDIAFEKVPYEYETKLIPTTNKCKYILFFSPHGATLLQPFSDPGKKVQDSPYVGKCTMDVNSGGSE